MMDDDIPEGGDPAEAFDRLRAVIEGQDRELALLRRAVEGLAAERAHIDVPDYSETLGRMQQGVDATAERIAVINDVIARSPALDMTPEQMTQRIGAAGAAVRRADHDALTRATGDMTAAAREVRGIVASALTAQRQSVRQLWFALGGLVAGILLWMVLPGLVARELAPTSWQWPEKLAARSLGADSIWDGARRMAAAGSPGSWNMMSDGAVIVQANRKTLAKCQNAAVAAGKPVKCKIMTGSADGGTDDKQ